jgi:hypothetical protein
LDGLASTPDDADCGDERSRSDVAAAATAVAVAVADYDDDNGDDNAREIQRTIRTGVGVFVSITIFRPSSKNNNSVFTRRNIIRLRRENRFGYHDLQVDTIRVV